jgi:two-component system, OmpR family, phosphate regulon response regulator OmpR
LAGISAWTPARSAQMNSTDSYHLYLVDDDTAMSDMLSPYLERHGLSVTAMRSAEDMFERVKRHRPDLIVLDVGLPGMSGLQACQRLRGAGDAVPIIMLTAHDEESDRILGLEMGADDYLTKPFSSRELVARARAVLRRIAASSSMSRENARGVRIGEFTFVAHSRSLRRGEDIRVLNTVEHALLAELTDNPGIAIARERLMQVSHTRSEAVLLRAVDAAIMRLRRLVEPDSGSPLYIQTVRGQGYMFVPQE